MSASIRAVLVLSSAALGAGCQRGLAGPLIVQDTAATAPASATPTASAPDAAPDAASAAAARRSASTPLAAPPLSLTGRCVAVPRIAFAISVHTSVPRYGLGGDVPRHEDPSYGFRTTWDRDLDGDGVLDARVPRLPAGRAGCPEDVRWAIYLVRGGCGYEVGELSGGLLPPTPAPAGWFAELATERDIFHNDDTGRSGLDTGFRSTERWRYRFDGSRYQEVSHEETGKTLCHDCSHTSSCSPPQKLPW